MRQRPAAPYEVYVFAPAAAPRTSDGGEDHLTGEIELQADVSDEAANDVQFNSAILAEAPANVLAEEALARPATGLAEVLREFRDKIVAVETPDWQPHRSILRESMIETLIAQKVRDPNDWFLKIPQFQRTATNPIEKRQYLDRICEIIDRYESGAGGRPDHTQGESISRLH
jgi:hypothetical protein